MEQLQGKSLCSKTCGMWILLLILILMPYCDLAGVPAITSKCYECGGPFGGTCEGGEGKEIQDSKEICLGKTQTFSDFLDSFYEGGRRKLLDAKGKSRQSGPNNTLPTSVFACMAAKHNGTYHKTCFVGRPEEIPVTPQCSIDDSLITCLCVGDLCNKNGLEEEPPQPIDYSSIMDTSTNSRASGGLVVNLALTGLCMAVAFASWCRPL